MSVAVRTADQSASVDLYWIPLGEGGHSVAFNGKVFEATAALFAQRPRRHLYHSAREVVVPEGGTSSR